jgi:ribokinase
MFGAVGRDAFASLALANLQAAGVDLSGVAKTDAPTGVALINVADDGENAITVVAGANARVRGAQVPAALLAGGSTLLMQLEVPAPEVALLAARARLAGARVILNAAPAVRLPAAVLRSVDVLIVNEHEASEHAHAWSLPAEHRAFLSSLAEQFGITAILTLGARGVVAVAGDARIEVPAHEVAVVDTTGAGDAFAGALAAELDRGIPLAGALAQAALAGARACMHPGAQRPCTSA